MQDEITKDAKDWIASDVEAEVRRLDPALSESDESFGVASALIASVIVGPDMAVIRSFMGKDENWLPKLESRLRDNDVWIENDVNSGQWFEDDGSLAFWLDVCVGSGMIEKAAA